MTSKERLKTVLSHKNTGRIVVEFDSTPVTVMYVLAIEKLRQYYGLGKRTIKGLLEKILC